ncbi:hypothetical protein PNEG_00516 [Pneumocystis murina B123]|uniref:Amino acid transporter transmembrane domain-containing protein n=1 Tax=Pneumocystis murina (strain B123) TaxID=1069680 RepID=M7NRX4_PNEMU|nr:hypothetical protein PNEG_00516 [Pneumocystis murina B123]EMR11503.1 hypothetical protein PNEG_00516 [Pneumocystis murina B123]
MDEVALSHEKNGRKSDQFDLTGSHSQRKLDKLGSASFISSVSNLLNTIIGAGVLAMPYALSSTGILGGIIILFISAITSGLGLYFLAGCALKLKRGEASFHKITDITFPSVSFLFDAIIAVKCFGVTVTYLILIGDVMPQVIRMIKSDLSDTSFLISRHFWITIFMAFITPFMFLRRLDSLRYISIVSLFSISYLTIIVIKYFFQRNVWNSDVEVHFLKGKGINAIISSVSVFIFAYNCHENMFTIVNEIRDNSRKNIAKVIFTSIGLSSILFLLLAILGYLTFGVLVPENIILGYEYSVATTIARVAVIVVIMFSYPLQGYPCRVNLDYALSWNPKSRRPINRITSEMSNLRFNILTCMIIVFSYLLAMTIRSFERVLSYVGSIGSTATSFILPGLYYSKLVYTEDILYSKDDQDNREIENRSSLLNKSRFSKAWYSKMAAISLAVFGIIVALISFISNILYTVQGR